MGVVESKGSTYAQKKGFNLMIWSSYMTLQLNCPVHETSLGDPVNSSWSGVSVPWHERLIQTYKGSQKQGHNEQIAKFTMLTCK